MTLHQGMVESAFIDSLSSRGIQVERPVVPLSMNVLENQAGIDGYPVNVRLTIMVGFGPDHQFATGYGR
jgi:phenol 2-monooxygenase